MPFGLSSYVQIPELRDRDYEDRLHTLKLPSLYYRGARGDMIEAYKFTHSIYKTEQEPLQRETNTMTRDHSHKLKKERCSTRTRANFFRHRITNRWNNLCDDVVTAPSLNSFKSRLDHQSRGVHTRSQGRIPVSDTDSVAAPKLGALGKFVYHTSRTAVAVFPLEARTFVNYYK